MSKVFRNKKKYKSIRSILSIWFIIFSIIPILFISWYSLIQFKNALDAEVMQRLESNGREIETILSDFQNLLFNLKDKYGADPHFQYYISISDTQQLKLIAQEWLSRGSLSSVSFYDRDGRRLNSTYKDDQGQMRSLGLSYEKVLLNQKYLESLKDKNSIGFVDITNDKMSLVLFSKLYSRSGKTIGYFEQMLDIKDAFLLKLKSRLKVELFILNDFGKTIATTQRYLKTIKLSNNQFKLDSIIEISTDKDQQKLGFILYPVTWDKSKIYFGIGSDKQDSQKILKKVRIAFITVILVVALFLILTILIMTDWLVTPIEKLISGLRSFDTSDQLVQVQIKNNTEIGLMTEAFNEMSYKIYQTRSDLKKKIKELEIANTDLKEAQSKLVHSAKMTSLGQLVAGVAHELNNPIGFIFSNTAHLKEYSEKLFELIETIEKNPLLAAEKKLEIDYNFIKNDLPKLIKSCQDGAQRTRDIVLGLRNFSRLEEAQLKEISIIESLDTTLELLKGEFKNRIEIHKHYENVPHVLCYASQINQVFMNILSNAVQAISQQGQIWISVTAIKGSFNQSGKVQISIQDSGTGMDRNTLEKVFEPFFTTKDVGQGTGLGLSISYGIIQNHGGEIQVKSQLGVGTEFTITIPIRPPQSLS